MRSWTAAYVLRYGTSCRLPISPIVVSVSDLLFGFGFSFCSRRFVLLEKIRRSQASNDADDEGRSRWRHGGVKSR